MDLDLGREFHLSTLIYLFNKVITAHCSLVMDFEYNSLFPVYVVIIIIL